LIEIEVAIAELLRADATAVTRAAGDETVGHAGALEPLESITNFVHRLQHSQGSLIVKANVTGRSKPSSLRWLASLPSADRADALAMSRTRTTAEFRREARGLHLLSDVIGSSHVPTVLAAAPSSLLTSDVGGRSIHPSQQPAAWRMAHTFLSAIWSLRTASLSKQQRADLESARSRSIVATFRDKFVSPSATAPIADLVPAAGLSGETSSRSHVVELIKSAKLPTNRVIYGDLKPEHIVTNDVGVVHLIDPALQFGSPAEDVARYIGRWLMNGTSSPDNVLGDAALLTDVAKLSKREHAALAPLIVMDACNIWSTRALGELLRMPQGAGWPQVSGACEVFAIIWTQLPRWTTLPLAELACELSAVVHRG
jgi:hypothetical protein